MELLKKRDISADVLLTYASWMLDGGSGDSVSALTSVVPIDQASGGVAAFREAARRIAEAHHYDVDVSVNATHLRVRFSRPAPT